jgi:hypothetical protein
MGKNMLWLHPEFQMGQGSDGDPQTGETTQIPTLPGGSATCTISSM